MALGMPRASVALLVLTMVWNKANPLYVQTLSNWNSQVRLPDTYL